MTGLDEAFFELLGTISRRSYAFDMLVYEISDNALIKGGTVAALLWWCWGRQGREQDSLAAMKVIVGALIAVAVGRILQMALPYRVRPMHADLPEFTLPYGVDTSGLVGWSSFPSDHAVLFFALAVGIRYFHRGAGAVAFVWAAVIVCLPRIYMGLHYLTDVLVGMVVGIAIMEICLRMPLPDRIQRFAGALHYRHSGLMHAVGFLVTFQIATLFNDARLFAGSIAEILR